MDILVHDTYKISPGMYKRWTNQKKNMGIITQSLDHADFAAFIQSACVEFQKNVAPISKN